MSALKFKRAQRSSSKNEGKTVSVKTGGSTRNTAAEVGQTDESTSSSDPTLETPKMVRSRPKLPSLVDGEKPNAEHEHEQREQQQNNENKNSDLDKLVGILNVLGTTDFVRKYSRKGRSATSSPAIPTSPTPSDLTSPGGKSSPPPEKRSGSVTPTRLRSIRVRLEKVKEDQDKQAEMERILAKYTKHRKTQIISQDEDSLAALHNLQPGEPGVLVLGNTTAGSDALSDSCSDSSSIRGGVVSPTCDSVNQPMDSYNTSTSKSVCESHVQRDSASGGDAERTSDNCMSNVVRVTVSESVSSSSSSSITANKRHSEECSGTTDKYHKMNEDLTNNNSVSDVTDVEQQQERSVPVINAPCSDPNSEAVTTVVTRSVTQTLLQNNALTVNTFVSSSINSSSSQCLTADAMRQLSEGPDEVFLSPIKKTAEDEGYIEESDLNLSADSDVCSKFTDIPPLSQKAKLEKGLIRKDVSDVSKSGNIVCTESRSETMSGSSMKRRLSSGSKSGNGRFHTHPPASQKNLLGESSVIEGDGFSSILEQASSVEMCDDSSTVPKDSQISLADSQFSPSETSEIVSTDSLEHLEDKNRRSFKQKSKSDPCGKQTSTVITDIPKVIEAHCKSVPILSSNTGEVYSSSSSSKKEQKIDRTSSKEDDNTTVSLKQRILQRISRTKEVSTQTKEDSTGQSGDRTSKIPKPQDKQTKSKQHHQISHHAHDSAESSSKTNTESGKATEPLRPPERPKRRQRLAATAALNKQIPKAKSLEETGSIKQVHLKDPLSTSLIDKLPSEEISSPVSENRPNFLQTPSVKSGSHRQSMSEKSSPVSENYPSFSSSSPVVTVKKHTLANESTQPNRPDSFTLSLPSLRKTNITRSHSSASMIQHKMENSKARVSHVDEPDAGIQGGFSVPELISPAIHRSSTFTPTLEPISQTSHTNLCDRSSSGKEKRDFIVTELYNTEKQYVQALRMLVEKYMVPLKTQSIIDSNIVDDIFYKINEIYVHHATFLSFLQLVIQKWDSTKTVGDIIYKTFSKQTVIESYVSFIINFPKAEKVLDTMSSKSAFQKFIEQIERETRSKLPLKAQVVKPAQRIPRYELLLKRLLDNTNEDHPDYRLLKQAEAAIHQLALKINSVKAAKKEDVFQNTLKKLELLLITDLVSPERLYVRHEQVQVLNRKDQCCIWLFSDLLVLSSIKRKSGPVSRKTSLLLHSPTGNDYVENMKQKLWLRVPLEEVEIVECTETVSRRQTADKEELEEDFTALTQVADMAAKLHCAHQSLDDSIHELLTEVNRKLSESQLKSLPPDATRMHMMASTPEGVKSVHVVFATAEKKVAWATLIEETRNKLLCQTDSRPPEFVQALQITKTRAGMQFSCAAPVDSLRSGQQRDVWVCNSDGYVGHMCLLSLQPEPIVTINTPVPGCNSRILCICAVPPCYGSSRRDSRRMSRHFLKSPLSVQDDLSSVVVDADSSESSSSDSDEESVQINSGLEKSVSSEGTTQGPKDGATISAYSSTMWLGTEDGCIHIFQSSDNIKTTRNKLKVKHNSSVLFIMNLEKKVFVSLANGDIIVYSTDREGQWNVKESQKASVGSSSAPVNRILAVAGSLWCSRHTDILILNPQTLQVEHTFTGNPDSDKPVQCMVSSGQGVWISVQGSAKVLLFHSKSRQRLLELSVAQVVAQKLQTADDIIRQHKTACLRITSLLTCRDLLWIGTSAGVILTVPIPKVLSSTAMGSIELPAITGLPFGHTGHVRFLTSIEVPVLPNSPNSDSPGTLSRGSCRRISAHTRATRLLVISGGDGYEDFRTSSNGESVGKDDSTNHLLQWQV